MSDATQGGTKQDQRSKQDEARHDEHADGAQKAEMHGGGNSTHDVGKHGDGAIGARDVGKRDACGTHEAGRRDDVSARDVGKRGERTGDDGKHGTGPARRERRHNSDGDEHSAPAWADADDCIPIDDDPESLLRAVESACWKGEPTDRLARILARLPREDLERYYLRLYESAEHMPRSVSGITQRLAARLVEGARDRLADVRGLGPEYVEQLRIVMAAGGRIDTPKDDVFNMDGLSHAFVGATLLPYLVTFRTPEGITRVMPREIREALAGVDWDEQEDLARRLWPTLEYLSTLVQWRGIVDVEQAYPEYAAALPDPMTRDELIDTLLGRYTPLPTPYVLFTDDVKYWLIHGDIVASAEEERSQSVPDYLMGCVRCNAERAPRPLPPDVTTQDDLLDWITELPSCEELMDFLDEHVPEDEDLYQWTWELTCAGYDLARKSPANSETFCELARHAGCRLRSKSAKRLLRLHQAFARDVPRWALNGWSTAQDVASTMAPDPSA